MAHRHHYAHALVTSSEFIHTVVDFDFIERCILWCIHAAKLSPLKIQRTFIFFGMKFPSWYSIKCRCKPNASIKYCGCGSQILLDWLRYCPVIRCSGTFPWMSAKKSKQQKNQINFKYWKYAERKWKNTRETTRIKDMMKYTNWKTEEIENRERNAAKLFAQLFSSRMIEYFRLWWRRLVSHRPQATSTMSVATQ